MFSKILIANRGEIPGRILRARRVMLHCARLVLPDLVRSGRLAVASPPPDDMAAIWRDLGGGTLSVPESDR